MSLNILQALHQLLGNNTPQAKRYAKNPQAREFVGPHAPDPAQFGYPADNSGSRLVVNHPSNYGAVPSQLLLGISNLQHSIQGGQYNPGLTPLQNVRPPQLNQNPQFSAFNSPQSQQFNPQNFRGIY